jgi:hypothetical protein
MKRSVLSILFVVVAIAMLMGLNRKCRSTVKAPFSEAEEAAIQKAREIATPGEAVEKASVESTETGAVSTVHENSNIGETSPYDRIVTQRRHDLSPRLVSVITNQLNRLGPLEAETYDKEDWENLVCAKMDYIAGWAAAVLRFANQNGGRCPETLDQAVHFYPADYAWLLPVFDTERFEIVYHGSLNDLRDPPNVILVRERVPSIVLRLAPHWQKGYIYGNGESGMVSGFQSTDEFQMYESQRLANSDGR